MSRFTIFTIILGVSVITVTADLVIRDYYGDTKASVIVEDDSVQTDENEEASTKIDITNNSKPPSDYKIPSTTESFSESVPADKSVPITVQEAPVITAPPKPRLTEQLVKEAGFEVTFGEKHFNGRVFQLLDIAKIPVDNVSLFELSRSGVAIASITEIALRDEIAALQLYTLLQNKTKPYIDLSLNETNAYGDRSFYINHSKKPDEAFLTLKIGKNLYSFAYVKVYHPQLKKLIQLLIP